MRPERLLRALAPLLAVGGAACISNEPSAPSMCDRSSDCDQAAGEVCDEGVCYGDPPAETRFAAVLVPAEGRTDLAMTELSLLAIESDGTINGLDFAPSISVSGRVLLACPVGQATYSCGPTSSIAAQITVERVAGFKGGPPWSRQVVATAGVASGGTGFTLRLPRDAGATYQITITPEASDLSAAGATATSPAEVAPPRQLTISAGADQSVEWYLGEPRELKAIRGCVLDEDGGGGARFAGMRVTALGRWTALGEMTRASSLAVVDGGGCFRLLVPIAMRDDFDVLVKPVAGTPLPTLRLFGEVVPDPIEGLPAVHEIAPALLMPRASTPKIYRLPVLAPDSGGGQTPVAGADVRFTTSFAMPVQPEAPERVVDVRYEARAVTAGQDSRDRGVVEVPLVPGVVGAERVYRVAVLPPAGSEYASAWAVDVQVGPGGGELSALVLDRRTAVTGRIEAASGGAIAGAPVEVRLSSLFRWNVEDPEVAAAAEAIPLSTATTEDDGRFFLWLDRHLFDMPAYYDLDVKPAIYAAPRWSLDGITLGSGVATDLGELRLPEASYARGPVHDPSGASVPGAELRLYQLPDDGLCERAPDLEPADCDPPAVLRGVFASDELGVVRPVLPDP
jgi:hypothetical protein